LFSVTPTGGSIDASGSGAVVFNNGGSVVSADPAPRSTTDTAGNAKLTLPSVADLVVGMAVTGTNIPAGTTIVSINPTASSITLSAAPTAAGADVLSFSTTGRTLTLTGTNTGGNTLGNALSDSAGGGTLSLAKNGAGAWRLTAANTYTGTTTVNGGTLQLAAASRNPVLAGAGGADIRSGRIVFEYSGSSPAGTIASMLAAAYPGNFASGQLRSSTATGSQGLGWLDDGSSTVQVAAALYGDANLDGSVDLSDFTFLAANFNGTSKVWAQGDFNYDGAVDLSDFTFLAGNFNKTLAAGSGSSGAVLGATVPEPTALSVLALTGCALARRRRR
jgi:autotransporter-associated beta strand protein